MKKNQSTPVIPIGRPLKSKKQSNKKSGIYGPNITTNLMELFRA
jgi:hypothetical protein